MVLVSEFTTKLAPTALGTKTAGEATVLSTTYSTPARWHSSPMASKSGTWVPGLAMVSTNTMRVLDCIAAWTLATWQVSTSVTNTPKLRSVPNKLLVLPKMNLLATTWSPALSKVSITAVTAPMPVAKQMVPSPPSMRVSLSSSAAVVGVPWRA